MNNEFGPAGNVGGTVSNNLLRGNYMGHGFAVAGVSEFTVTGNVDHSRHVGVAQEGCGGTPAQPSTGFLAHAPLTSNRTLQPEFGSGNVSGRWAARHGCRVTATLSSTMPQTVRCGRPAPAAAENLAVTSRAPGGNSFM
ncbi:MAG TPA: hypothetical protein VF062_18030 [Candidatus Limnocylindrales bacterium]